jgi:hypothetical protein
MNEDEVLVLNGSPGFRKSTLAKARVLETFDTLFNRLGPSVDTSGFQGLCRETPYVINWNLGVTHAFTPNLSRYALLKRNIAGQDIYCGLDDCGIVQMSRLVEKAAITVQARQD